MSGPQKFGKYMLVERIAVGGMAEIYRAKTFGAAGFEKDVCIKRILPQFSADDDFVRMFIDEARLAAKLQHANIVQIFDFDCADAADGASYYLAMELVEGKDVRHLLKEGIRRNVSMSTAMCLHVAIEALKGLHYAHTKAEGGAPLNIVHRDVSPHNLICSFSGEVKISDFGIAKAAARASATSNGMVKGKLAYMSPEQVTGQPLDRRTDVYSMGIVLYEMLTRTRLFAGTTDAEVITKVRDAVVPPLRQRNPQVPLDVEQVVMKMLAAEARARFQSAAEASRALSQTTAYSANESAPLGEFVAKLFPPTARRSAPAPAPAARPQAAAASVPVEAMATVMGEAPSPEAIARAVAERARTQRPPAGSPGAVPITDAKTAMVDPSSPQHAQIQAQIKAANAKPVAATPGPAKSVPSIMEASTAILDPSSPQHAQVAAQVQAALAARGGGQGAAAGSNLMNASTAILDPSSPAHAQVQAQINAAQRPRGGAMAGMGPPPAAPPLAGSGPPPAAPGGGGGGGSPQRTVMLDASMMAAPVAQPRRSSVQPIAPMSLPPRRKQSTWGRWVLGPFLMGATAAGVWLLAGYLLPPAVIKPIEQPPIKLRPVGHIQLKTTPPGAQVKLDEQVLNHFTPTTLDGPVGVTQHLTVTLAGYKPHEEDVLFAELDRPLIIVLDKIDEGAFEVKKHPIHHETATPPPPKVGKGTISIFVHPWAVVYMDNVRLRQTPIANLEVPTGPHEFQMVNETLKKSETVSVTIKPGANPEIRLEFGK